MFSKANLMKIGVGAVKIVGSIVIFTLVENVIELGLDYTRSKISEKKKSSTAGEEA